nr:hypothetical protein [Mesorhizobium sp.]
MEACFAGVRLGEAASSPIQVDGLDSFSRYPIAQQPNSLIQFWRKSFMGLHENLAERLMYARVQDGFQAFGFGALDVHLDRYDWLVDPYEEFNDVDNLNVKG